MGKKSQLLRVWLRRSESGPVNSSIQSPATATSADDYTPATDEPPPYSEIDPRLGIQREDVPRLDPREVQLLPSWAQQTTGLLAQGLGQFARVVTRTTQAAPSHASAQVATTIMATAITSIINDVATKIPAASKPATIYNYQILATRTAIDNLLLARYNLAKDATWMSPDACWEYLQDAMRACVWIGMTVLALPASTAPAIAAAVAATVVDVVHQAVAGDPSVTEADQIPRTAFALAAQIIDDPMASQPRPVVKKLGNKKHQDPFLADEGGGVAAETGAVDAPSSSDSSPRKVACYSPLTDAQIHYLAEAVAVSMTVERRNIGSATRLIRSATRHRQACQECKGIQRGCACAMQRFRDATIRQNVVPKLLDI